MASNDGIIWITYRGRKIPIKPGMNGKFNKKKLDEIREKNKKTDNTMEEYLGRLKKERQELLNTNPTSAEDGKRLQNEIKNLNYKINDIELKRTKEFNTDYNNGVKEYAKKNGMSEEYVRNSIEANKSEGQKLLDTVEKNKAGREYRDKLNKISDKSIPDGTYDVDTGKAVDFKGEGYNVSFEQSGVKLTNDEYYDRIEECRNKCDGKVYGIIV